MDRPRRIPTLASVPQQVSNAVQAVIRESGSDRSLDEGLEPDWCRLHQFDERSAIEASVGEWERYVSNSEGVHARRQADAGDSVSVGADPGELWLVDGEVRRGGSEVSLVVEQRQVL